MPLTALQNKRLVELTFAVFTLDELRMTLKMEMGLRCDELVNEATVLKTLIFDLCEALERLGQLGDFIAVVILVRPSRPDIQAEFPELLKALDYKSQSAAAATKDLTKGLTQVQGALDDPAVRGEAEKAKGLLTGLADTITNLEVYKSLHDQLHILQGNMGNLELAVADMTHGLADSVLVIRSTIDNCAPFVAKLPALVRPTETVWLTTLRQVAERLERADDRHRTAADDAGREIARNTAADALLKVRSVLMGQLSRIDGRIGLTASGLKLEGLGGLFQAMQHVPTTDDVVKQGMATAQVNAGRVESALKSRVNRHEGWQTVMLNITLARETLASIAPIVVPPGADESEIYTQQDLPLATAKADFDGTWKSIVDMVTPLQASAPDAGRSRIAADCIASMAAARELEAWAKAAEAAAVFAQVCGEEFLVADGELKKAATEVAEVGSSIIRILNSL